RSLPQRTQRAQRDQKEKTSLCVLRVLCGEFRSGPDLSAYRGSTYLATIVFNPIFRKYTLSFRLLPTPVQPRTSPSPKVACRTRWPTRKGTSSSSGAL